MMTAVRQEADLDMEKRGCMSEDRLVTSSTGHGRVVTWRKRQLVRDREQHRVASLQQAGRSHHDPCVEGLASQAHNNGVAVATRDSWC